MRRRRDDVPLSVGVGRTFYGWWVVFACLLLIVVSSPCHSFGINVFVPHFMEDIGIDSQSVSLTWAIASFISACLVPVAGGALDRFGARLLASALAVPFIGNLLLLSRVETWAGLTACVTMLRFIGAECFCLIASATVQRWFVRLRGRATSVLALNGIVLIQMPVFMTLLIDALGWRNSYVALAIALGALLGVALLLIRSEPASMGLLPDGGVAEGAHESACNGGNSRGCDGGGGDGHCGGGSGSGCTSSAPPLSSATLRAASKHPLFWCLASLNLFNDIFWAGFNYHYIATVRWFGGALRESSELTLTRVYFVPLSIGLNGAQIGAGMLFIDRVPVSQIARLTAIVHAATAVVMMGSLLIRTEAALSAFAILYGVVSGLRGACLSVVLSAIFGTRALGRIQGFHQGCSVLSTGSGPLMWAISLKYTGGYMAAITFAATGLSLAAICTLIADQWALGRARARGDQALQVASDVDTSTPVA